MKRCPDCAELSSPDAQTCATCQFNFDTGISTAGTSPPVTTGGVRQPVTTGGVRQPVTTGEKRALWFLSGALLLMLVSLVGPWWQDSATGWLSGDDRKGSVFLEVLTVVLCLVVRFATPVRTTWVYPPIAAVSAFALYQIGEMPASEYSEITLTGFAWAAIVGSLLALLVGIAATIVALRQPNRQAGRLP